MIMDNFSGHSCDEMLSLYNSIDLKYLFLPPDCTPIMQPFDVSVAKSFKSKIKTKFLDFV